MESRPDAPAAVTPAPRALDWKTQSYLLGIIGGLLLGVLAAYLYVRATEENTKGGSPKGIKTGDAMKLTLSILTLVRQIAEIGGKS